MPTRTTAPVKRLTLAQVRRLPATCKVGEAAAALGIGRATAYDQIAAGTFPATVIPVGRRLVVVTASLLALLDPPPAAAPAAKGRAA